MSRKHGGTAGAVNESFYNNATDDSKVILILSKSLLIDHFESLFKQLDHEHKCHNFLDHELC